MTANSIQANAAPADLAALVEDLKNAWRDGHSPDAAGALREFPSILAHRSLVIDLAYEEYCLREEAGDVPDADSFCSTLPAYRSQMREVIRGHRLLADHPEMLKNAAPDWPAVGDQLDSMPLVRELGRGAFARVYLAIDPRAGGRHVVLKLSQLPSTEAHTLGPIEHKHVVGIHWARQIDGFYVICMPFVAATTLQDAIDGVRAVETPTAQALLSAIDKNLAGLPLAQKPGDALLRANRPNWVECIVSIMTPLASALAYLHGREICHGDLKPSNILLGPGGLPYLIDFNLASSADVTDLRTGGTLPYMAPERIQSLLGQKTETFSAGQADIYSFGVVLFECLTRRLPFPPSNSANTREVAKELLNAKLGSPPSVRKLYPAIPSALRQIVEGCLDPNPVRRPTAAQVEIELRKLQPRGSGRLQLLAAAAAIIVGVLVGSLALANSSQAVTERAFAPKIVDATAIADPFQRGMAYLEAGQIDSAFIALSEAQQKNPNGETYAYIGYCHSRSARHDFAAECYLEAVKAGFDEPWVRNNRAYSLTQFKRNSSANLATALKEVSLAHQMAPDARGIQFNWAFIRFLSNFDSKTKRLKDDRCVEILKQVMAHGPYDAELYYKAGLILAASAQTDADQRLAIAYLTKAVEMGKLPKNLEGDPVLKANLGGRSDFSELLALSPGNQPSPRLHLELVNPTE